MSLCVGTILGWSSPAIPKLLHSDSPIHITSDENSWIVAALEIGSISASIPNAWIMDKYNIFSFLLV